MSESPTCRSFSRTYKMCQNMVLKQKSETRKRHGAFCSALSIYPQRGGEFGLINAFRGDCERKNEEGSSWADSGLTDSLDPFPTPANRTDRRFGGFHIWHPQSFCLFYPLPPLCPQNLYCLFANLVHFLPLLPLLCGRLIWKPPLQKRWPSEEKEHYWLCLTLCLLYPLPLWET